MTHEICTQPGIIISIENNEPDGKWRGRVWAESRELYLCLECQGWIWPDWVKDGTNDEGHVVAFNVRRSIRRQLGGGQCLINEVDITNHTTVICLDSPGRELVEERNGWVAVYLQTASGRRELCQRCRQGAAATILTGRVSVRLERPMEEAAEAALTRPRRGTMISDDQLLEWWAERRGIVPPSWL